MGSASALTIMPALALSQRTSLCALSESRHMSKWPVHGKITGPIVLIGFGSIGRGILPLIERHFDFDKSRFTVIDPDDTHRALLDVRGIDFVKTKLTPENYRDVLTPLLAKGEGQPFIVNLSVEVSSCLPDAWITSRFCRSGLGLAIPVGILQLWR
jgi:homospermidine synthase